VPAPHQYEPAEGVTKRRGTASSSQLSPAHWSLHISGGVLGFPHAIPSPPIDQRLQKRYQLLLRDSQPAGRSSTNAPPGAPGAPKPAAHRTAATFAQTPSRFVNNHRVTHAHLLEPLLAVARRECQAAPGRVE